MKKQYYAYVPKKLVDYFNKKIDEHKNEIEIIHSEAAISENNEQLIYYVLEAEEGIIDSRWELK